MDCVFLSRRCFYFCVVDEFLHCFVLEQTFASCPFKDLYQLDFGHASLDFTLIQFGHLEERVGDLEVRSRISHITELFCVKEPHHDELFRRRHLDFESPVCCVLEPWKLLHWRHHAFVEG